MIFSIATSMTDEGELGPTRHLIIRFGRSVLGLAYFTQRKSIALLCGHTVKGADLAAGGTELLTKNYERYVRLWPLGSGRVG